VLDVDPDKGGDDSLRKLETQYGSLPVTAEVITGGGGHHYYFQHPGISLGNSAGKLGPGLDIRTDGGQVVAPPSVHPMTGRTYEWEGAHHPDDIPPAPVPSWLLDKLATKCEGTVSTKSGETILEGQRNDALAREAGKLRRIGLNGTVLEAALLAINRTRCTPPLPDDEVRGIADSVGRYPTGDDHGGTQADQGLIKELTDEILATEHFARDAGGQLYVFECGAYRPHGEASIAQRVKAILLANGDSKKWSSHRAREVHEFIRVDAPFLWERPPVDTLNLLNGLLDLPTRALKLHTPEQLSLVQLPVTYDPTATCPRWESFIARVLPDDCRTLPYELVAASMRGDVSDQQAVLLVGSGENGKSTLLDAIVSFLGRENVASLALQRLELDKFSVVRLLGKLANICADLPSDHLTSTSTFKALTGGDRLTGERKFQGSFEVAPFARLLFSTNFYPQSKDSSQAFFRRWLVVPFDTVIEPHERTLDLAARLAGPHELSGVLNQALSVLPAITSRGGFSQSETTRAAMMEFREMTDPLAAWLDRFTALTPDRMVTKKDLLIAYNGVAEVSGRPPMSPKAFYGGVKRLRPTIREAQRTVRGGVQWVFLGLELTSTSSQASRHSRDSSQISLGRTEQKEMRVIGLTGRNAVNPVKAVNEHIGEMDPCFRCKGTAFWESIHGAVVCAECHPPSNASLVKQWINGGD
jgi:P4 family phage/plasmid primase-like protien